MLQQSKQQTKLTWKFIPEPTPAQIQAAKENSNNNTSNNQAANQAAQNSVVQPNGAPQAPNGQAGVGNGSAVPISSQAMLGPIVSGTPQIKNHTATLYKGKLWVFGGYDGKKNHSSLRIFDTEQNVWIKPKKTGGNPPMGRNGHTATLVDHRLYIIGGWLGQGPLAADDLHILDLDQLRWLDHSTVGEPPGPCNMHTADAYNKRIYVFRGGDGRDYLNDLHELDTLSMIWIKVAADGFAPPPRANHSSSLIKEHLYIFGGWDGSKRLNDLFVIDLDCRIWSQVNVQGESPVPRAGMSLCNVADKLYLFGGSGPHAQCFNDLYTFDPTPSSWTHCNSFTDVQQCPKMRAGHSMTLVGTKLYIIGGSYGQDYLKDVYELNTDPCPEWDFEPKSKCRLFDGIASLLNNADLSDVTFMVEEKPFYAHKNIVSILSEKYRAMFKAGMKESQSQQVVPITHISYTVFEQIMGYLYRGEFTFREEDQDNIEAIIDILRVADEEFLDDVKMKCEQRLIELCSVPSFVYIDHVADMYNANRLKEFCQWFQRIHPQVANEVTVQHGSEEEVKIEQVNHQSSNNSELEFNDSQMCQGIEEFPKSSAVALNDSSMNNFEEDIQMAAADENSENENNHAAIQIGATGGGRPSSMQDMSVGGANSSKNLEQPQALINDTLSKQAVKDSRTYTTAMSAGAAAQSSQQQNNSSGGNLVQPSSPKDNQNQNLGTTTKNINSQASDSNPGDV